jgi:hypothetical protein
MNNFDGNNFPVYQKEDFLTYALCPIRGEIDLPYYKPEEKVRLSLIYYLVQSSEIFPDLIDMSIESDRLDISLYNKCLAELRYYFPPLLIIETKREDYNLINAYGQLKEYLHSAKGKYGLLFNVVQAFKVTFISSQFVYEELPEPYDIVHFISDCILNQNAQAAEEKEIYYKAKNGDFNSFKNLAIKYRRNKRVVFKVSQNNNEFVVEAHLFQFEPNLFTYVKCGSDLKSDNKPFFENDQFSGLIAIRSY